MAKLAGKILESRIRRELAKDNQRLRISRGRNDLGIHVVDQNNVVLAHGCSLEGLAMQLGLINDSTPGLQQQFLDECLQQEVG